MMAIATTTELADLKLVRKTGEVIIDLMPLQGLWTEAQYLKLTNQTNHLIEFTDGYLEVLPMPTRKHQAILAFLYEIFLLFIRPRGGKVLFAPLRLQVAPGRFREPDLLLLLNADDPRNQNAFWLGADLVVEVVSPDNPEHDLVQKRQQYADAGIPEYWIVNPIDETITVLRLEDGRYTKHGVFGRGVTATSAVLAGFAVGVATVFDAD